MYYAFSDGFPVYEVVVAVVIAATLALLTALPVVARVYERLVKRTAQGLWRSGLFRPNDLDAELRRLDLLRIVLAAFVIGRFWPDFLSALQVGDRWSGMWTGLGLLLSSGLAVGLATPACVLLLSLLLNLIIDNFTSNVSLGSMVVANCLIPLLIAPAGHTLSVDSWLMRQSSIAGAGVRGLYGLWGAPNVERIHIGRFLALVAYAAISIYSAVRHLESPTWTSGATTGVLLLSPVASPAWSPVAESAYRLAPSAYVWFSLFSSYGMLLWQLLLIPLAIVSRWTRWFVIVWGVGFFAFSTYVLHLKRLGVYECVLWAIVFWSGWKIGPRDSLQVFFDDRCNMCDRVVRFLSAADLFGTVRFLPLSQNRAAAAADVEQGELVPDLVGRTASGDVVTGYALYCLLCRTILLLMPLWVVLTLGRVAGLGPRIYRFVADRRRQLFGVCQRSTYRPPAPWVVPILPARPALARAVTLGFGVLLLAFGVRYFPDGNEAPSMVSTRIRSAIGQAPLVFGVGPVEVFNESDLRLFRTRATPGLIEPDGTVSRVAYTPGEAVDAVLTRRLLFFASESFSCDEDFAKMWFSGLAQTTPASHPYRRGTIFMEFTRWSHPTNEEFARFANVPVTWDTVCVVKGKLDALDQLSAEYGPEAIAQLVQRGVDFTPTSRRISLVLRFPCQLEQSAAALSYDTPNGAARGEDDLHALQEMFKEAQNGPLRCLSAYKRVAARLGAAEQRGPYVLTGGTCESHLELAEKYFADVFDKPLRDETAPTLEAVRAAQQTGQLQTCRTAVGAIRQSYFEAIYGAPSGPAGDQP